MPSCNAPPHSVAYADNHEDSGEITNGQNIDQGIHEGYQDRCDDRNDETDVDDGRNDNADAGEADGDDDGTNGDAGDGGNGPSIAEDGMSSALATPPSFCKGPPQPRVVLLCVCACVSLLTRDTVVLSFSHDFIGKHEDLVGISITSAPT